MNARTSTPLRDMALGATVFIWLALLAWARPLLLPDEGRYVGVAWEMVRSHDWLTPTLNGLPYFHKPPLFYWLTASSLSLFGLHELPARLASLLGAWWGAMALFVFVRKWLGQGLARTMLMVLLCQPLFYLGAQFANLDMLVAGLITATVCLLADAALSIEHRAPHVASLAGAYACAALGLLAKGLIGFVLPALVVGLWLLLRWQWRTLLALLWWPGAAIIAMLAAPWFLAMQQRFPAFLDYFFVVQHFKRFSGSGFNNAQPPWFYPAVLALLTAPWLLWLRPLLKARHAADIGSDAQALRSLWVVWAAVIVGFFSIPHSKLLGYVLPAVPPMAALIAEGITAYRMREGPHHVPWRLACSTAMSLLMTLAAIAWLSIHPTRSTKAIAQDLLQARAPGQQVVMLENYYFDVPFYAALKSPVTIIDDWAGEGAQRDNWRKELVDAGSFAPGSARAVLQPAAAGLPAYLCQQHDAVWIIGTVPAAFRLGLPASSRVVAQRGSIALWHWQPAWPGPGNTNGTSGTSAAQARCAGTPTDG